MIFPSPPSDWQPKFTIVAAFIFADDTDKYLLLQSADHKVTAELWGQPAGKVEECDQDCLKTALSREVFEETQIQIDPNSWTQTKTYFVRQDHNGNQVDFPYHTFESHLKTTPEVIINPESKDFKWVTPEEGLELNLIWDEDEVIKDHFKL